MGPITAATKMIALLGHPVAHSLSPQLQNAALNSCGVPAVYLAFDVSPAALAAAVTGLRALHALGANVTLPHKQTIMPLLDVVDPEAERIGSVNTVVNVEGVLTGYNTDAAGFLAALRTEWRGDPRKTTALLLGAGGAARAVASALCHEGIGTLLLWNRTPHKAGELATACSSWGCRDVRVGAPAELREAAAVASLIVNATSAGMAGAGVKESEPSDDIFQEGHFVVDLRYGHHTCVAGARERGAQAMDGWEMLVQQAAMSFRLWTGLEAPVTDMRAAVPIAH